MDMGNSRTPNEQAIVHRDCPEMFQKSKDVLELGGHNRMLRSQCLESELHIKHAFEYKEYTIKTYLRGRYHFLGYSFGDVSDT